jgi:hypothetical protein
MFTSELGVYGQSGPNTRVTAYSAAFRYRRKIYRDSMVMEVLPQLIYNARQRLSPGTLDHAPDRSLLR